MNKSFALRFILIKKEFQVAYRDRTIFIFTCIVFVLLSLSGLLGILQYQQDAQSRQQSNKKFSSELRAFHADAHDVAHYGTYLFKPLSPLTFFDPGLNDYFGTSYRVEAHVQHEVDYSNAEGTDTQLRFGSLTLTLILQVLLPLLYLTICCTMLTQEREQGTLKMLLTHGTSLSRLLWSKIIAYYMFAVLWLLPVFIGMLVLLCFFDSGNLMLGRYGLLLLAYLVFYFSLTLIAALVSLYSRSSRAAIQIVLGIWLLGAIVLPKIGTTLIDQRYPLISRAEFNHQVRQGYLKGINGDGDSRLRVEKYLDRVCSQYGVKKLEDLPLNVDGLVLQYNENYQQKVFDYYYANVEKIIDQQQQSLSGMALLNPFVALKRLSMALSGTDFFHHQQFFQQAKDYRNTFIRRLNTEVAQRTKQPELHMSSAATLLPAFHYRFPTLSLLLWREATPLFALLIWPWLLAFLLVFCLKFLKN
ncbi:ABC transporter permease subunit [Sphingobacterium sp. NGMCC 1.201703]|uniref:ABC transporter permease subunit n=1 Tax=Sphingobacterium sp. NGMCC 1.201703 TaxID=3388657 RepID=UPI0039FDC8C8